jgi:hypothetical protein
MAPLDEETVKARLKSVEVTLSGADTKGTNEDGEKYVVEAGEQIIDKTF